MAATNGALPTIDHARHDASVGTDSGRAKEIQRRAHSPHAVAPHEVHLFSWKKVRTTQMWDMGRTH